MAKITHPDMRRVPDVSTSTPKENTTQNFVVEDMSEQTSSLDEQLAAFEQSQETPTVSMPKINANDQKKLESLIFMGRHSKEVEIAGHKFELSTLTHRENNEIAVALTKMGESATMLNVRIFILANALKSVDGADLSTLAKTVVAPSPFEERTGLIDQMQLALVERLYNSYEELVKEADSVVYGEKIKN